MGYKADDQQVIAMSRTHSNAFIARRLGISPRQVSRILAKHKASKAAPEQRNRTIEKEQEQELIAYSRSVLGESLQQVGYRFGLSRQAVHQRLISNE